jgi:integrase
METANHFSSVESDFYSIKWVHQMAGVPDPCISEVIKNIVEASKRKLCRPIKKNKPITPEEMIQLFKSLNTENRTLKDLRVLAMLAISYTGFLRYNELSNIKANNITFYEDYVNIVIVKSKTDCYRNGKNVVISKLDSLQCPLNILRCYLEEANIEMNTDMYIFRALTYI